MRISVKSLLVASLLLTTAMPAAAAPIIYTITGKFKGTIGGNAFENVSAVFTGTGDTSSTAGGFGIPGYVSVALTKLTAFTEGDSVAYNISTPSIFGIYDGAKLDPNNTQRRLGFVFNGDGGNGIALESNAFNGYSGLSSFAQTPGNVYYQNATFTTDRGVVNITGFTEGTFAAAVPETATWMMMILGFGGIGFALRRNARVRTSVSFG